MEFGQSRRLFVKNVLLLSATALLMRSVSLSFSLYLKNKLGTDGIGLFSLIMNLFSFAVTLATSGVSLLATRLVSEALGRQKPLEVKAAMKRCLFYALSFGLGSFLLLFLFADAIGIYLLKDARTVLSLRALAISLPFLALSSALSGYFIAVRRVVKSAAVQVGEQFLRIILTVMALSALAPPDLSMTCLFVVLGAVLSDLGSFCVSYLLYRRDLRKHNRAKGRHIPENLSKRMLAIALPVAISSYFRSALVTLEHLLIPRGLVAYGLSHTEALAAYGVLEAMVLPIILFPYAFLTPFCNLLIPEVSERCAAQKLREVKKAAESALGFVCLFGIGTAGVTLSLSEGLGEVFCSSSEAATYIALLAPLIPIMYADTTVDALLKGLDEQGYTMRVNLFDSLLGVLLAFVTLPLWGIRGYLFNLILCELINFSFSAARLFSKVRLRFSVRNNLLLPLGAVVLSSCAVRLVAERAFGFLDKGRLLLLVVFAALCYSCALSLLKRIWMGLGKKRIPTDE